MATKTKAEADKISSNNLMIIMVLVTLLVVGATALIVKTVLVSITLDNKIVSAKNTANKQLIADVIAAPQLIDAYQALGSQSLVLADALPTTADFPTLIVTMDNMASAAGIQLSTVSPSTVGLGGTIGAVPSAGVIATPTPQPYAYSVSFTGTYTNLIKFLGEVETSARPMRVNGIQLDGNGSGLSGQIDMETFYQAAGQLPFSEEAIK